MLHITNSAIGRCGFNYKKHYSFHAVLCLVKTTKMDDNCDLRNKEDC